MLPQGLNPIHPLPWLCDKYKLQTGLGWLRSYRHLNCVSFLFARSGFKQLSDCTSKDFTKFTSVRTELPQYAALLAVASMNLSPEGPWCVPGPVVSCWGMGWVDLGCSWLGLLIT